MFAILANMYLLEIVNYAKTTKKIIIVQVINYVLRLSYTNFKKKKKISLAFSITHIFP